MFDSIAGLGVRYVSPNDHTPGQGQFGDVERYIQWMSDYYDRRGADGLDIGQMHRTMASRAVDTETLPAVYARVLAEAERAPLVLATHDDDSPGKVDLGCELGARVAEYPVAIAAARRARERGLSIVVGAPNIVCGGSQSGNLDARELIELDLADIISADYHAPSLLPAAFRLVDEGLRDLPAAIRMLTLNPARAVGLPDRGAFLPDQRADLALVRRTVEGVPVVEALIWSGQQVFSFQSAMFAAVG